MPGIFGARAPLTADLILLLELIVFAILIIGITFGLRKTGRSFKTHGRIMSGMIAIHIIGILLFMVPSLVVNFSAQAAPLHATMTWPRPPI